MGSRLKVYEAIITSFLAAGYKHLTVKEHFLAIKTDKLRHQKIFIHRHDIDTDLTTARKMFEIEKKYGIKATYYFRLSTLDLKFMRELDEFGSEASYHFEELATYCKKQHIKDPQVALNDIGKIRELFILNFRRIEAESRIKLSTVCSHGDFVNRALNLKNHEITRSMELREKLGISGEAYDRIFMENLDAYISDQPYPGSFLPEDIFACIGQHNRICLLTHPRHWYANLKVNTFDNLKRLAEGFLW